MPSKNGGTWKLIAAALAWALGGWASPALAGDNPGLSPQQRQELLRPLYERAKTDPSLAALDLGKPGRMKDPAAVEAYLKALPLSPLERLKLDMFTRRFEVVIPKLIDEWHTQWIGFHEDDARKLYGDAEVDARLARRLDAYRTETVTLAPRVAGNRNLAATSFPAPEDYQGEIQIAVNPSNTSQIVAAANTWDSPGTGCGDGTIAIFYSGNGGTGWGYTCAPDHTAYAGFPNCTGTEFGSDPALAWNASGEVFLNYMLLCTPNGSDFWFSMVVARSANGGATWTAQGVVKNSWPTPNQVEDKNFYVVDRVTTSPYNGRHYTCWDRNNNEKFAYSTNNGVTWTEVDLPSPAVGTLDLGCDLAIDKAGKIHLIFNNLTCGAFACTNTKLYYTTSVDGGSTWTNPRLLRDYNLTEFSGGNCPLAQNDRCIGTLGSIDVDRSGGPCDGTVYVTFDDFDTGQGIEDTDVWVTRGVFGGALWFGPTKVNNAGFTEAIQFHPTLAVDQYDGELAVVWHDGRNHPNNKLIDIYYGTSRDCGVTFSNLQLTQASTEFNNSARTTSDENSGDNANYNPNQYGEYLGVDLVGSTLSMAWTDTRHYYPNFSTESQKENVAYEARVLPKLGIVNTYYSLASEDGWVQESSEFSGVGDYLSTTDISVGDNNLDEQRKGILSFSTSDIPDAATILFARLKVKRKSLVGTDPFTTHGVLLADIKSGTFGTTALEASDFEATAGALGVCWLSDPLANGDWAECSLNATGISLINKTGRTQIRLHFAVDDNDDAGYDNYIFYGGEAASTDRPQLIVTYE
ncbi:MAG TPA: exo-alpha-sialidase [Thermoanaerobaculia bacterium]|nr:exo-alpha-sialidase [Thermoanaerobaculia bacterium]